MTNLSSQTTTDNNNKNLSQCVERGIELIKGMMPYPMNTYLMCVCLYVPKVFMFNGVNMGRKVLRSFSFSFPHSLPTTAIFFEEKKSFFTKIRGHQE